VDAVVATEPVEHLEEQRVAVPMVERDLGRRADDDEPPHGVDAEPARHRGVGLEVGEVVLLLEPRVRPELRRAHAVAREPVRRDDIRDDDPRRCTAAELVLEPGELVVEGRRARDSERPGGERQVVRPVREREVEVAPFRPAAQRRNPRHLGAGLADRGRPAVATDRRRLDPMQLEQLHRLRVLARGHLDLVAALLEQPDQGTEDEHVRGVGQVDPDAHRRPL
jgi:hypothetical protein